MSLTDTIASEALAAAVGGAVSSGVLYPLEVLKTRLQADDNDDETIDVGDDKDIGEEENPLISPPKTSQSDDLQNPGIESNANTTSVDYARNLYRSEGLGVFFDGMEVSAFQSAVEKACYFFAYTALKRGYAYATTTKGHNSNSKQQLSAFASVLLGCLAEWMHLPVTLPLDALTTAIQTSGGSKKKKTMNSATDNTDRQKTHTVLALWMSLWKEKSFYKGIQAYWILCFKPALQYTVFEQLKGWILRLRQIRGGKEGQRHRSAAQLSSGEAFLLGMFSRTVATLLVFPFLRAKVRMQSLNRTETSSLHPSSSSVDPITPTIWELLTENYANGGLKALYKGLGPELTRGVLSAALMMMVKERISGSVKNILHGGRSP